MQRREPRGSVFTAAGRLLGEAVLVVACMGGIIGIPHPASAQIVLLSDSFNAATLNPRLWCYADDFGGSTAPTVDQVGEGHGDALHVRTPSGGREEIGALYNLPILSTDIEALQLTLQFRLNSPESTFYVQPGKKVEQDAPGVSGCLTTASATVRSLPWIQYLAGLPGEEGYPFKGFTVTIAKPTSGKGAAADQYTIPASLDAGRWYTLRLSYTRASFAFYLDGTLLFHTIKTSYTFSSVTDVLCVLGAGNSHAPCDMDFDNLIVSVDNALLSGGDVNGDGRVNILDVKLCEKLALGVISGTLAQQREADVNGDGAVTQADVQLLAQYVAAMQNSLP